MPTKQLCSGYNPPQFVIDAAKSVFDRVDCNQYAPTKASSNPVIGNYLPAEKVTTQGVLHEVCG